MTLRTMPSQLVSRHVTAPPGTNGREGLGGQKVRPVATQQGRRSRPSAAPFQKNLDKSFTTGARRSAMSAPLENERVAGGGRPHGPPRIPHLAIATFATKLDDELAKLAPSV